VKDLIESVKSNEGFRSKSYLCSNKVLTIGYGFAIKDLELDEDICDMILERKLQRIIKDVNNKWDWVSNLPDQAQEVIYELVYQIGLKGVSRFRLTLAYLANHEFLKASKEMLDSKWARSDSPNRALRMSKIIESLHESR
jgi:lysozyme